MLTDSFDVTRHQQRTAESDARTHAKGVLCFNEWSRRPVSNFNPLLFSINFPHLSAHCSIYPSVTPNLHWALFCWVLDLHAHFIFVFPPAALWHVPEVAHRSVENASLFTTEAASVCTDPLEPENSCAKQDKKFTFLTRSFKYLNQPIHVVLFFTFLMFLTFFFLLD